MAKSNNMVFILAVVLLLVSVFGAFVLLSSVTFVTPPVVGPQTTQHGELKLTILPDRQTSMSTTGYLGFEIPPGE